MIKKKYSSPDKDAGWGLIYRMNSLWSQVDPKATSGDYEGWNFVLDRIYCNLLYDDEMIIKRIYKCDRGHTFSTFKKTAQCLKCLKTKEKTNIRLIKIESVELSEEDELIYKFLTTKIKDAMNNKINAIKSETKKYKDKPLEEYKEEHYRSLMMKDIWLRKFMQGLGLYLKVVERDLSNALLG
jgi:hypothetical protein